MSGSKSIFRAVKKSCVLLSAASLIAVAPCATASTPRGFLNVSYKGQEVVGLQGATFAQPPLSVRAKLSEMGFDLQAQIVPELQRAVAGLASLKSASVAVAAPMRVDFVGAADGNVVLIITAPKIVVDAAVEKSWYASANIRIAFENVVVSANYNVFTGLVNSARVLSLPYSVTVNVDGVTDILDFFLFGSVSEFINGLAEDYIVDEVEEELGELIEEKVTPYSAAIFGLDSVIPDNIFYQGRNISQEIKDFIARPLEGRSVSIEYTEGGMYGGNFYLKLNLWNEIEITTRAATANGGPGGVRYL